MKFEVETLRQAWRKTHPSGEQAGQQAFERWMKTAMRLSVVTSAVALAVETGHSCLEILRLVRKINDQLIEGKPVVI